MVASSIFRYPIHHSIPLGLDGLGFAHGVDRPAVWASRNGDILHFHPFFRTAERSDRPQLPHGARVVQFYCNRRYVATTGLTTEGSLAALTRRTVGDWRPSDQRLSPSNSETAPPQTAKPVPCPPRTRLA